ncbi:MAG: LysR substrate-binding domain-containing protein [Gammaproteobacteria bacterium]
MIITPKVSLRGLRTFCIAAKHQSFRVAGEELFITSSAVSHQVKSLERELGVKLFERKNRLLNLTETGKSLYEDASPLIEQLGEIAASYKMSDRRSHVRVSVQPFFASEIFVPRLTEFSADHPDIDIEVGTSDETAEKHPANADLSIRLFRTPPANLKSHLLSPLRVVPAGSPEFSETLQINKNRIVSPFPIIVHQSHPRAWKQWSNQSGIQLPSDSKFIRLDSMIAAARAAERGMGAALVPVIDGSRWFESGSLTRLFDEELVIDFSYYLVYDADRAKDESVARLRDWILDSFA